MIQNGLYHWCENNENLFFYEFYQYIRIVGFKKEKSCPKSMRSDLSQLSNECTCIHDIFRSARLFFIKAVHKFF